MRVFNGFLVALFVMFLCLLALGINDTVGRSIMLFLALAVVIVDFVYRRR